MLTALGSVAGWFQEGSFRLLCLFAAGCCCSQPRPASLRLCIFGGAWVFIVGMNRSTHRLLSQERPLSPPRVLQKALDWNAPPITPGLRPPLKWAGGKRWLLPYLRLMWHDHAHRRIVEPFAGGLAITLGLQPKRALVNDINSHLISFYRWLKRGLVIPFAMSNSRTFYDLARARFNRLLTVGDAGRSETAALFYYLNRTGYNGLCRFNRSGMFNVPFGRHARIDYARDFSPYQNVLQYWAFVNGDFEQVPLEAGDFVYADPPYDAAFTSYAENGFTWDDQVRVAEWLARHRGPVVLSNAGTTRIVALYRKLGFKIRFLDAPRSISCGDRTPAPEVLATRNLRMWRSDR